MSIFTDLLFLDGFIATPKALEAVDSDAVAPGGATDAAPSVPVARPKHVTLRQAAVVCQLCG